MKKVTLEEALKYNGLENHPACLVCGKPVKWKGMAFKKFCSGECKRSEIGKRYMLQRYKQTCIEKYGVDNASKSEEVRERISEANAFKATEEPKGCAVCGKPTKLVAGRYKLFCSKECRISDIGYTLREEKTKSQNLQKYGVINASQSDEIKSKKITTSMEHYGVENPNQSLELKEIAKKRNRIRRFDVFLERLKQKHIEPLFTKEEYVNSKGPYSYKCTVCGDTMVSEHYTEPKIACRCHLMRSTDEIDVFNWISSLIPNVVEHNKRFYYDKQRYHEIDIFIPSLNIGIEYHGIYWHSDLYKERLYHYNKYKYLSDNGIPLIQIFQNEWINQQDIVKSVIMSRLNHKPKVLYARKCTLGVVSSPAAEMFCTTNHLQGYAQSQPRIGLYHDGELVQLLCFGKARFSKNVEWELIRSCSKLNTQIVGGFERLFKWFTEEHKPKSIVSYCDNRWFTGDSYEKNGFVMMKEGRPDYFYFKSGTIELFHRTRFQKHKQKALLVTYDNSKSEYDNMISNGYLRIFDAGNKVFIWKP